MRAMSAAIKVRRVRVILPMLSLISGCRFCGLLRDQFFGSRERESEAEFLDVTYLCG